MIAVRPFQIFDARHNLRPNPNAVKARRGRVLLLELVLCPFQKPASAIDRQARFSRIPFTMIVFSLSEESLWDSQGTISRRSVQNLFLQLNYFRLQLCERSAV
jgi:hypothetical protein